MHYQYTRIGKFLLYENPFNCNSCPVILTYPCNSYPYPTYRIKCIHCSGTNCQSTTNSSLYCKQQDHIRVSINYVEACTKDLNVNDNFVRIIHLVVPHAIRMTAKTISRNLLIIVLVRNSYYWTIVHCKFIFLI